MSSEYFDTGYIDEPDEPEDCTCDSRINHCPICKAAFEAWLDELFQAGILGDFTEEAEQRRLAA